MDKYDGYYVVLGNPVVNFIKNCIEYVIGIVILLMLIGLILKGILYIIAFFKLTVGDFTEDYIDSKIDNHYKNKKSERYNRANNCEKEENPKKYNKKHSKKEDLKKEYKKAPIAEEYKGMTPEEILEDMNKKF